MTPPSDPIDEERYTDLITTLRAQIEVALATAETRYARPPTLWQRLFGLGPRDPGPLVNAAWHLRKALKAITPPVPADPADPADLP
jgi:hypothetical protein